MNDVLPRVDSGQTLDDRIEAVLSGPPTSAANIKRLIQEAVIAAGADGAGRDTLQVAIKRLRAELRELKAREDRCRLLAKIGKIVGPDLWRSSIKDEHGFSTPKTIVKGELFRLEERCGALKRLQTRGSAQEKDAIEQFIRSLRKLNRPNVGLSEDLRLLLGIDQTIYMLGHYKKWPRTTKTAYARLMAALSAARLCERFGIELTTTRKTGENTQASKFCRLAAVLSGDERTNMQPYCREAAKEAARQRPGDKMPGQK